MERVLHQVKFPCWLLRVQRDVAMKEYFAMQFWQIIDRFCSALGRIQVFGDPINVIVARTCVDLVKLFAQQ
jgi:hypothetical protein